MKGVSSDTTSRKVSGSLMKMYKYKKKKCFRACALNYLAF